MPRKNDKRNRKQGKITDANAGQEPPAPAQTDSGKPVNAGGWWGEFVAVVPKLKTWIQVAGLGIVVSGFVFKEFIYPEQVHLPLAIGIVVAGFFVYGIGIYHGLPLVKQQHRAGVVLILAVIVILGILGAMAIVGLLQPKSIARGNVQAGMENGRIPKSPARIELVSAGFDKEGKVDIKVRNAGESTAFLIEAVVQVKRRWKLPAFSAITTSYIPPSKGYTVHLPNDKKAPFSVRVPISHEVKGDAVDRFTFAFLPGTEEGTKKLGTTEGKKGSKGIDTTELDIKKMRGDSIYMANLALVYNENDRIVYTPELLLFVRLDGSAYFARQLEMPAKEFLSKHVTADRLEHNKKVLAEVRAINVTRSPILEKFDAEFVKAYGK